MKSRAILSGLAVGLVSMTLGSGCCHPCFPNLGWRFHQCPSACGAPCAPACPPPCGPCSPVGFRPPAVVPDCPGCNGPIVPPLPAGYPPAAYPPVIGNPMPLPGQPGGTTELHQPSPVPGKMGGN